MDENRPAGLQERERRLCDGPQRLFHLSRRQGKLDHLSRQSGAGHEMHVCARTAYPAFRVERGGVAGVRRARRQRNTASGAVARTLIALALTHETGSGITASLSFVLATSLLSARASACSAAPEAGCR